MKLWLDDEREAPEGWEWAKTADEAVQLIRNGKVTEVSLDRDLGESDNGTGEDVLRYIELKLNLKQIPKLIIHIHTANVAAKPRMLLAVERLIEKGLI